MCQFSTKYYQIPPETTNMVIPGHIKQLVFWESVKTKTFYTHGMTNDPFQCSLEL